MKKTYLDTLVMNNFQLLMIHLWYMIVNLLLWLKNIFEITYRTVLWNYSLPENWQHKTKSRKNNNPWFHKQGLSLVLD